MESLLTYILLITGICEVISWVSRTSIVKIACQFFIDPVKTAQNHSWVIRGILLYLLALLSIAIVVLYRGNDTIKHAQQNVETCLSNQRKQQEVIDVRYVQTLVECSKAGQACSDALIYCSKESGGLKN